jgi:hypothetical protein
MIKQIQFNLTPIIRCWNPLSSMHRAILTIITIPVLLLASTVAISVIVSEDAFARERYSGDSTSQAAAVSNDCLNPILDSNTIDNAVGVGNCGSTVSQQDESGSAAAPITSQTANPTIEVQRATTTQPPLTGETCAECFDPLSAQQISEFESLLPDIFDDSTVTTIEQMCAELGDIQDPISLIDDISEALTSMEVDQNIVSDIRSCLIKVFL